MADNFKKSGLSFEGVSKAEFEAAQNLREQDDLAASMAKRYKEINDNRKKTGDLESFLKGELAEQKQILADIENYHKGILDLSDDTVTSQKKVGEESGEVGDAIQELAPGLVSMARSARTFATAMQSAIPGIGFLIAGVILLYKTITGVAKKVAETRKDLGVSAMEAVKIEAAFFGIEKVAALSGLEAEDLKESFKAARDNLGATRDEAIGLSLSLAQTAMRSGQTSSQLTTTLSLMESISGASRDALLSQIEMTGQMLEQKGLAPGDIFKDVADNAEHFASFAKDGGANIFAAAASAKQLGLNMSAVASTTEALLDFETSIEKQMEASLLLGRQINLDRARQLALSGDQEGMMQEILKQVGGEAEFNRLNVLQRRALAESVGQSVENLSRLVRNNTATTTAGTVAKTSGDSVFNAVASGNEIQENIHTEIRGLRRDLS